MSLWGIPKVQERTISLGNFKFRKEGLSLGRKSWIGVGGRRMGVPTWPPKAAEKNHHCSADGEWV